MPLKFIAHRSVKGKKGWKGEKPKTKIKIKTQARKTAKQKRCTH